MVVNLKEEIVEGVTSPAGTYHVSRMVLQLFDVSDCLGICSTGVARPCSSRAPSTTRQKYGTYGVNGLVYDTADAEATQLEWEPEASLYDVDAVAVANLKVAYLVIEFEAGAYCAVRFAGKISYIWLDGDRVMFSLHWYMYAVT